MPSHQGVPKRITLLLAIAAAGGIAGFALSKGSPAGDLNKGTDRGADRPGGQPSALSESSLRTQVATDSEAIAAALDSEALKALWDTFRDDQTTRGFVGRKMVMARWAEVAPEEALAFFIEHDPRRRIGWVDGFMVEWILLDPQAAAETMIAADLIRSISGYADAVVLRSPVRALELVAIADGAVENISYTNRKTTRAAFEILFAKDRESALAMLEEFPTRLRPDALAGIAAAMAAQDIKTAEEWAQAITDPDERLAAMAAVIVELGKRDPDAAIPYLSEFEDPFFWNKPGGLILRELTKLDPRRAIEWAGRHIDIGERDATFGYNQIHASLREFGAEETLRIIAGLENQELRKLFMSDFHRRLWARDPGALLSVVDEFDSPKQRAEFRRLLVPRLPGLQAAYDYLDSLPPEESPGDDIWLEIFKRANRYAFDQEPDLFWEAVEFLPTREQGNYMTDRIERIARARPAEAEAIVERMRGHPHHSQLVYGAGWAMWQGDPVVAQSWVESLEGEEQGRAASGFASAAGFGGEFRPAMFEWLRSLNVSEGDMVGATRWVQRLAGEDPEQAIAIIGAMDPGRAQQSAIAGLVEENVRRNRDIAEAWIDQIENSEVRADMQRRLDRP